MNCPKCQSKLLITDRQGVEVDFCPDCRGVWLDRGEIDKIIERESQYHARAGAERGDDCDHNYRGVRGRRKPWWAELFD